jgi:hypothetical protein
MAFLTFDNQTQNPLSTHHSGSLAINCGADVYGKMVCPVFVRFDIVLQLSGSAAREFPVVGGSLVRSNPVSVLKIVT